MEAVLRGLVIYLILYVIVRVAGKRTLSEMNAFDLLLLLIISEATQEAMIGQDHSMTHAIILIVTLVGLDIVLSLIKRRSRHAEMLFDSVPLVLVENGKPIRRHMNKERIDEDDVLRAARENYGISKMDEIHLAILERDGKISIIPRESGQT